MPRISPLFTAATNQAVVNIPGDAKCIRIIDYNISSSANTLVRLYFRGGDDVVETHVGANSSVPKSAQGSIKGADYCPLFIDITGAANVYLTLDYEIEYLNRIKVP
jgi:hypothetical protein